VDLSIVSVREATDFLLSLAESSSIEVSERAIFPVTIADSVEVWPRLLRLAKDDSRPREVRKAAVFWEVALMALSQLPESRGVPALLDVARTSEDREMRKRAIFWLGQTDDPQALALLEEILTSRR
jgi:HEAT repeat protein